MSRITEALAALRTEARQLETRLTKVHEAIAVLGEADRAPARKKAAKKATRKRKPLTAAQKKAILDADEEILGEAKEGRQGQEDGQELSTSDG